MIKSYLHTDMYMSKMNRPLAVFALLFVLLNAAAVSCSKKGSTAPSKTTLITASAWKYSDAGIDADGNGTIDGAIPAGLAPVACQTDFLLTFKSDKTGTYDEGATKCLSTDPQTYPFTWDFANNETQLSASQSIIPGFSGPFKIIELSETKLTLSLPYSTTIGGIPITTAISLFLVH